MVLIELFTFLFLVVFKKTVFLKKSFRQLSSEEIPGNSRQKSEEKVVYIENIPYTQRHLPKIFSDES